MTDSEEIWFHYYDYLNNSDDYSVLGWEAAGIEAASLIKNGIGFICDDEIKLKIDTLLENGDWKLAVELYNEHNACKEHIAYRQGGRVF